MFVCVCVCPQLEGQIVHVFVCMSPAGVVYVLVSVCVFP